MKKKAKKAKKSKSLTQAQINLRIAEIMKNEGDWEVVHCDADNLLCDLLRDKYPEVVEWFENLEKWYA